MSRWLAIILVALHANASAAQDEPIEEGLGLVEEGLSLLLRGLRQELEPAMRDLREMLDNLDGYHPPEVLPNGDIIIRRKRPTLPDPDSEPDPETGDVEL